MADGELPIEQVESSESRPKGEPELEVDLGIFEDDSITDVA